MVLYAAKLKGNAKPVSKKTDLPPAETTEPFPIMDPKEAAKLRRKEKAAAKKEEMARQEAEAKAALEAKEQELKVAEEALAAKKAAQKEKRKLAREAKKQSPTPPESVAPTESTAIETETIPKAVSKKRKRKELSLDQQVDAAVQTLEEPPAWFKKYVAGVKNEERELREAPKKPKKEVAKEADEMARQQWGNGLVRDRVNNEVDKHMNRMYQMIFNRSSFDGL